MSDIGWRIVFSGLLLALAGCGIGAGTASLRSKVGQWSAGIVVALGLATAFVGAIVVIWTVGR